MPRATKILIAGIGNIFLGDDAFGVEVAREMVGRGLPESVKVRDFGIRGYDLAYALAAGYQAAVLVDATPQGKPPGTVCLVEPDLERIRGLPETAADAHGLDPVRVMRLAATLGELPERVYLVGCEPAVLENDDGRFGLSAPVRAAVPDAVRLIESLVGKLLTEDQTTKPGLVPV